MGTLPKNAKEWDEAVSSSSLHISTIHEFENPVSASKISHNQFLLLRILWVKRTKHAELIGDSIHGLVTSEHYEKAKQELKAQKDWCQYLDSFTNGTVLPGTDAFPQMGTFSIVRHYQRLCDGIDILPFESSSPKISSRTRAAKLAEERLEEQTNAVEKRAEQRRITQVSPTHISSRMDRMQISPKAPPNPPVFDPDSSAESSTSEWFSTSIPGGPNKPALKDEQIVNTALLIFLMALPLHFDIPATWTIHRHGFIFGKGDDKVFEARVDGCLLSKVDEKIKAIVEVKAATRDIGLAPIRRQEGAQMAAWISSEPDLKKQERYR